MKIRGFYLDQLKTFQDNTELEIDGLEKELAEVRLRMKAHLKELGV